MSENLRYTLTVHAERNMGDHAEVVTTTHDAMPNETVEMMVLRVFPDLTNKWGRHDPASRLVIQVTAESADAIKEAL